MIAEGASQVARELAKVKTELEDTRKSSLEGTEHAWLFLR